LKTNEPITLTRDCPATEIPSGRPHVLAAGSVVRMTQALGGSYTVMTNSGYMVRVDSKDADALGISNDAADTAPSAPVEFSEKLVWDELKTVYDPEIPVNVVDLGLIYGCEIKPEADGNNIDVKMTMTAPGCGMGDILKSDIHRKLSKIPTVKDVQVELVLDPPWNPGRMSEAAKLQLGLDLEATSFPMY